MKRLTFTFLLLSALLATGFSPVQLSRFGNASLPSAGGGNNWVRGVTNQVSAAGPTVNLAHTNTAGRFDIVMIGYRQDTSQPVTSVTNNVGDVYTAVTNAVNVFTHYTLAIYYCASVSSGATNIIIRVPDAGQVTAIAVEYAGAKASAPLDQQSTMSTATSTSLAGNNITSTENSEGWFGLAWQNTSAATYTAGGSWVKVAQIADAANGNTLGFFEILNRATSTDALSATSSQNSVWAVFTVCFKGS